MSLLGNNMHHCANLTEQSQLITIFVLNHLKNFNILTLG